MKRLLPWTLAAVSAFVLLAAPAALAGGITDDGKFFSEETLTSARTEIQRFQDKFKRDVTIETFAAIPGEKLAEFNSKGKNAFFADWLRDRAKELKVSGIYILICKDPAHLQVGASQQMYHDGYSTADRDQLRDTLLDYFKKKQYDEGLTAALNIVANQLDELSRLHPTAHRGSEYAPVTGSRNGGGSSSASPASESPGLGLFAWLLIIVGGFLLIRLIAGAFRRPAYPPPPSGYAPGGPGGYGPGSYGPGFGGGAPGGGGFFSSLLGGMFGGMAGNWAANRWFGSGMENPRAPTTPDAPPGEYGSTGGDFGPPADSGGGDFGGAAGGGDFGGGGGGDAGGGGGGGDF